jgi:hypothetical protein
MNGSVQNPTGQYLSWTGWCDAGSALGVSQETTGGSGTERWRTFNTILWTMSAARSATVAYVHQYQATLTLAGTDGSHTVAVTSTSNGSTSSPGGQFASWSGWCDAGTTLSVSQETTGGSGTERWYTYSTRTWTVSSVITPSVTYTRQYSVSLTLVGLSGPYPATIHVVEAGSTQTYTSSTTWNGWCDAGASADVSQLVLNGNERWVTTGTRQWTASGSISATVTYYHQYTASLTLTGTDAGHTVGVTHIINGSVQNPTGQYLSWTGWCDDGSSLQLSSDTTGSTTSERWHAFSTTSWTITSPRSIIVIFIHQFAPTLTLQNTNSTRTVTVSYTSNSSRISIPGQFASWTAWCDAGTNLNASRLATGGAPGTSMVTYSLYTWTVSSAFTATVRYVLQYSVSLTLLNTNALHTISMNISQDSVPRTLNSVYTAWQDYVDPGSLINLAQLASGSGSQERWTTFNATTIIADAPKNVTLAYIDQVLVTLSLPYINSQHPITLYYYYANMATSDPVSSISWLHFVDNNRAFSLSNVTVDSNSTYRRACFQKTAWTPITAPLTITRDYSDQYYVSLTINGLTTSYPGNVTWRSNSTIIVQNIVDLWNGWVDAATVLTISNPIICSRTSYLIRSYASNDTTTWMVTSSRTATITFTYHETIFNVLIFEISALNYRKADLTATIRVRITNNYNSTLIIDQFTLNESIAFSVTSGSSANRYFIQVNPGEPKSIEFTIKLKREVSAIFVTVSIWISSINHRASYTTESALSLVDNSSIVDPFTIIIFVGVGVGAVVAVGAGVYSRKKKAGVMAKSKQLKGISSKKTPAAYAFPSEASEKDQDAINRKRERLLKSESPAKLTDEGNVLANKYVWLREPAMQKAMKMKEKESVEPERTRMSDEELNQLETEMHVDAKLEPCLVCKNELAGDIYICPACKSARYHKQCASALTECWVCRAQFNSPSSAPTRPVEKPSEGLTFPLGDTDEASNTEPVPIDDTSALDKDKMTSIPGSDKNGMGTQQNVLEHDGEQQAPPVVVELMPRIPERELHKYQDRLAQLNVAIDQAEARLQRGEISAEDHNIIRSRLKREIDSIHQEINKRMSI